MRRTLVFVECKSRQTCSVSSTPIKWFALTLCCTLVHHATCPATQASREGLLLLKRFAKRNFAETSPPRLCKHVKETLLDLRFQTGKGDPKTQNGNQSCFMAQSGDLLNRSVASTAHDMFLPALACAKNLQRDRQTEVRNTRRQTDRRWLRALRQTETNNNNNNYVNKRDAGNLKGNNKETNAENGSERTAPPASDDNSNSKMHTTSQ